MQCKGPTLVPFMFDILFVYFISEDKALKQQAYGVLQLVF